jgi:cation diffusion facilitator CzcD-associated flavoprotein CzcO
VRGRYLLTATGFLSQPNTPEIAGIESFAGKVIHTAAWDDEYDLAGRRVALIGTGATAVQLIPEIAPRVEHLTVYQRTPIWVTPKIDGDIPRGVQQLFARLPLTQRAARFANSSALEVMMISAVLHFRRASLLNRGAAQLAKAHLYRQVRDPELRRKLTPDYDFGCKRPTFSNAYYPTFNRPNVTLETSPITRIGPETILTADGPPTAVDTLVLATGYNIWDTNFPAFEIVGRAGRNLGKWWRENRFQAYEGVAIPYFPNYLSLANPYSYSGLSYFTTIESQMRHMKRLFGEVQRRGATTFEVSEAANEQFLERMTRKLDDSVFLLGSCATARSYYFNQHGEAALLRPTSTVSAFREADRFPLDDYAYA